MPGKHGKLSLVTFNQLSKFMGNNLSGQRENFALCCRSPFSQLESIFKYLRQFNEVRRACLFAKLMWATPMS